MKIFLVTLFFGWSGAHKFIAKKTGIGILYLFTFGLFGFGWLYDIIKSAIPLFKKSEIENIPDDSVIKTDSTSASIPESLVNTDDLLVKPDISKISLTKEKHHVAGTSYRQKEIQALGVENYYFSFTKKELEEELLYDERIYEYEFSPSKIELIEEPDNECDPNAIKLVIDGIHVGYIKKGSCSHVKKLLRGNRIDHLEANIMGVSINI